MDYIVENIGAINKTLEFQSKQLEAHIKRTEMLEERFTPIEDHVKFMQKLMQGSMYIPPLIGGLYTLLKVLKKI